MRRRCVSRPAAESNTVSFFSAVILHAIELSSPSKLLQDADRFALFDSRVRQVEKVKRRREEREKELAWMEEEKARMLRW